MQEAGTWRELLAQIITNNKEKQRLIDELKVTSVTLMRWVNGESEPRPQNLRLLMNALPLYRDQLKKLLQDEKGFTRHLHPAMDEDIDNTIPSDFYARVLVGRASTSENLRFWSTCHLILQQAIGQLDPDHRGMAIWIVRCMPPSGPYNKVRSLRESVGVGTPPWTGNLEQNAMFLGAESLSGAAVTRCQPEIINDLDEDHYLTPALHAEFEKSSAIYPILYAGKVSGVLLVSSAEPNYFLSSARTDLIKLYAELVALAFEPEDFYRSDQIALNVMPSHNEQKIYFARFRQLVAEVMLNAARNREPINNFKADLIVWQRLEEELLKLPVQ